MGRPKDVTKTQHEVKVIVLKAPAPPDSLEALRAAQDNAVAVWLTSAIRREREKECKNVS